MGHSADQCGKISPQDERTRSIHYFFRVYGGGFNRRASRLRGSGELLDQVEEESDSNHHLVVALRQGHHAFNVQVFLKVLDDNTISREFPGMEGLK